MISCIVLSAGHSSRFKSPKSLAQIDDELAIVKIQKMLISSEVSEIIVVLGAHEARIKPHLLKHKRVRIVYNKDYNFGQTSSFQCGLQNVNISSLGCLLLPVDYPFIKASTINMLVSTFTNDQAKKIVIPIFDGQKGHPPLFPIQLKNEFLSLSKDIGLNTIAPQHKQLIKYAEVSDRGVVQTFNTQEELERILNHQ